MLFPEERMINKMIIKIIIGTVLLLLFGFVICGLCNPLSVSRVTVGSDAIKVPVRIALISDLHSCRYGDGQKNLINALEEQAPDLVCLAGDIFDDKRPDEYTEIFLSAISEKYPCFYVTGNHECRCGTEAFQEKLDTLEKLGIARLSNENREFEFHGQKISICGVDDPEFNKHDGDHDISDALFRIRQGLPDGCFSLLLSHRPEYFSMYAGYGFDLTLCGHAHGGQWRIPGILENGLLAPNQGLFPEYTSGKYVSGDYVMVVSRGLARESTIVPRFYNRPEIVIIDLVNTLHENAQRTPFHNA